MEKLYKVEIARTPKSIVDAIRFFELEFGETYLEGNDIFDDSREIMEFAYKKGFLPKSRYENWKVDWNGNVFHIDETFQVIFGSDEEYEPFCITYEDEDSDDDYDTQYEKALLVYGELICSSEEYFDKFVEEFSSEDGNLGYVEVVVIG